MITDKRQKIILFLIIIILFVANIVTLYMLMQEPAQGRNGVSKKGNLSEYLKKELGFSKDQLELYNTARKKHQLTSEYMIDSVAFEKDRRFSYLASQSFSDSAILNVVTNMYGTQKRMDINILQHLREVRNIGTKEQQMKFDSGFMNYMKREKLRMKKLKD